LPGEKTDRKDGKRLAELTRHGQVRPSYVPPRALVNKVVLSITLHSRNEIGTWHSAAAGRA